MKILITSGGTKIPIDSVRSITNMSQGTFGSRIAQVFAGCGSRDEIWFLHAKGSKCPDISGLTDGAAIHWVSYVTFWDYAKELKRICQDEQPDIIILAAAVSDYEVQNPVEGKIRTKGDMDIHLTPLPKLISRVREWTPTSVICGFKLLVDSTVEDLILAGDASLADNQLDLVVCNDLRDIRANAHQLHIVERMSKDLIPHNQGTLVNFGGWPSDPQNPPTEVHRYDQDQTEPLFLARVVATRCIYHTMRDHYPVPGAQ